MDLADLGDSLWHRSASVAHSHHDHTRHQKDQVSRRLHTCTFVFYQSLFAQRHY